MTAINRLVNLVNLENLHENESTVQRNRMKDLSNPLHHYNDVQFHCRFRFSKAVVLELAETIFGNQHRRSHSVPNMIQLLVTLRYYASGNFQRSDGDIIGIDQSTVCRIVHNISRLIACNRNRYIKFPATFDEIRRSKQRFFDIAGFPCVVGAIDCTHVKIVSPGGESPEIYRNRKGFFSLNVQCVCNADLQFINTVVSWHGSAHDARIFENSRLCCNFENGSVDGVLVGDGGYPSKTFLLTPLTSPSSPEERAYNRAQIKTRICIERAFGVLKRRFRCFDMFRTKLNHTFVTIVAVLCLHNLAIARRVSMPDEDFVEESPVPVDVVPVSNRGSLFRQQFIRQYFS